MLATPIVVLHVLSVLWLVAGVVGRDACYLHAARAADLPALRTLASLASFFEKVSVRPATFVVLLSGLAAAGARGYPILGFLHGEGPYWVPAALVIFLSIIPVIAFVFLPQGRLYRVALAEAEARGEMTEALRRAIADPAVGAGRAYEVAMVGVLTWLMVAKPF